MPRKAIPRKPKKYLQDPETDERYEVVRKDQVWRPAFVERAYQFCLLGATDVQVAEFLGISCKGYYEWLKDRPAFRKAVHDGRAIADARVAEALYKRACGYEHKAVKIFQHDGQIIEREYTERYPPDTQAAVKWLHNRQPKIWRERVEVTGADGGPLQVEDVSITEMARRIAFLFLEAERVKNMGTIETVQ